MENKVARALIPTGTKNELRQRICEQFIASELYTFAWVSRYNSGRETVTPIASAGIPAGSLDEIPLSAETTRQQITSAAVCTRKIQVKQRLLDNPPDTDLHHHAQDHGYQSLVIVPLVCENTLYGVLHLTADRPEGFTVTERESLRELGTTIAYAIEHAESSGDRTQKEQRLRKGEERLEIATEAGSVGTYLWDVQEDEVFVDASVAEMFGLAPDDAQGASIDVFLSAIHDDESEFVEEALQHTMEEGDTFNAEFRVENTDGDTVWVVSRGRYEFAEDGTPQRLLGAVSDITDRKQFERTLTSLHGASRDLIQAESKLEVSQRTVNTATDMLNLNGVAFYLFDDDDYSLQPAATTDYMENILGELPTFSPENLSITWRSFIAEETITHDNILETEDTYRRDTPIRSGVWIPLSDHGVFFIVSEEIGGIEYQTLRLADHLAATAQATLDRIEREESLREQENELAEQNRHLESLNRMNDIIREIDQVLIEATTQDAIEQAVCELLTQDERFAFAWISDAADGALTPRTWAGTGQGYLDEISLATDADDSDPAVTTAATGEVTLVSNVAADLRGSTWRKAALARNFQSAIAIPLQHNEVHYGVLTVYAAESEVLDPLSREVLGELGDTIANAMNAVETRRALFTDNIVELEVAIYEADDPLVQLAAETGGQLEFQGIVPQSENQVRVFVTASDVTADTVRACAEESMRIERVTHLNEEGDDADESRFEITVSGSTIPTTLAQSSVIPRTIQITDTETRVVVELPQSSNVRTFIERLETTNLDTELIARRNRERETRSGQAFETALTEDLTDRQCEVLQTAYLSGYFEWPREQTGKEVAEMLDITQSTFNGHLRIAEQKLYAMIFDGISPTAGQLDQHM